MQYRHAIQPVNCFEPRHLLRLEERTCSPVCVLHCLGVGPVGLPHHRDTFNHISRPSCLLPAPSPALRDVATLFQGCRSLLCAWIPFRHPTCLLQHLPQVPPPHPASSASTVAAPTPP